MCQISGDWLLAQAAGAVVLLPISTPLRPPFLSFLNVPFQREPSSLTHQIFVCCCLLLPDYCVWQSVAAGTVLRSGSAAPRRRCGRAVLAEELVCSAGGLEWKVNVLLFFPQAPQGCDPADGYSPSAELLLALRLVLLALGKPLWFSLLLCVVHLSLSSEPRILFIHFISCPVSRQNYLLINFIISLSNLVKNLIQRKELLIPLSQPCKN